MGLFTQIAVVILVGHTVCQEASNAVSCKEISSNLQAAITTYESNESEAREDLLRAIDQAIEKESKNTGKSIEVRLQIVTELEDTKQQLESENAIPTHRYLRSHVSGYRNSR